MHDKTILLRFKPISSAFAALSSAEVISGVSFRALSSRLENAEILDGLIEQWTAERDDYEVMLALHLETALSDISRRGAGKELVVHSL